VDLVRKQAELKYLDETSRKELNCAGRGTGAGDDPVPDVDAIAEAERLYEEVRARIEALGPVNAQAMEEFQEASQRQEFLSVQRQDLLDSIRDTEKAISGIDRFAPEIRGSLRAHQREFPRSVPDAVRRRHGEMRLTDETNLADSGIDIVCVASRQEAAERAAALRRREGAGGGGPADGHLPLSAQPVLRAGRSGRAAGRSQHRRLTRLLRRCRWRRSSS
jgi:chromosome segregation ATPase